MKTTNYYNSIDDVILLDPFSILLSKIFGKKLFVTTCECCGKIPSEIYDSNKCYSCYFEKKKK